MHVKNLENAEHYCWGDHCDGWYLLKSDDLTIIRERMPPGAAEAKHRHTKSRQFFYVLSGTATMTCDGVSAILNAGDGLEIPPGVVHQIANLESTSLEIIVTSQPPSHGDRINVQ